MNNRIRVMTVIGLCALGLIYLAASRPDPKYSLDELHNSQVDWQGTYFGILPMLRGKAEDVMLGYDPKYIPRLIQCLENDEQYVAAHVLLTGIARVPSNANGGVWNGLDVQLLDDRQITPPTCPPAIKKRWQQWQRTQSKSWFWLFD